MLTLDALEITQGDFSLSADMSFAAGHVTALIGPSGAGKSTLLSVVNGFFRQTSGRVLWQGKPIDDLQPDVRPVATLFQDNNLFPHLTISQNVGLALGPKLSFGNDPRVAEMLAAVGLAGMEDRKPARLSGGQQSRAALARVLLMDRPIVLLDEPFSALGPGLRAEMLDLVRSKLLTPDRCILLVTHDPDDARRSSDTVALIDDGEVAPPVPTEELFANPPERLKTYLGI